MQKRAGTVVRLASPLKALAQRFGFLLLVAATFGVMLLGKADTLLVERLRIGVADSLAPVLETVSEPVQAFDRAVVEFRELAELRQINADLRAENERLLAWHHRARQLEAENAGLRDILNVAPEPGTRFVTARVIGDTGSAFVRSVLVAAGADDGIVKGNAALAGEGLAGRGGGGGGGSPTSATASPGCCWSPISTAASPSRSDPAASAASWPATTAPSRGCSTCRPATR